MFVKEDASAHLLAPLYCSPYLVLERQPTFLHLQLGDRMDVVSVDRWKPAFSDESISLALPPLQGQLVLNPVPFPLQLPLSALVQAWNGEFSPSSWSSFLTEPSPYPTMKKALLRHSFLGEYCGRSKTTWPSGRSSLPYTLTTQYYTRLWSVIAQLCLFISCYYTDLLFNKVTVVHSTSFILAIAKTAL